MLLSAVRGAGGAAAAISSAPGDPYVSVHIQAVGDWTIRLHKVMKDYCAQFEVPPPHPPLTTTAAATTTSPAASCTRYQGVDLSLESSLHKLLRDQSTGSTHASCCARASLQSCPG